MAQISLPFEKLLTPQGLSELKTLLDQAIGNPADTVKVVFAHLRDAQDQPFQFPVDVTKTTFYIFKTSVAAVQADKAFLLHELNSLITEFEIKLNLAATTIEELKFKAETELNTIKNKVNEQLAKIPYEINIRDNNGNKEFFINQTEEIEGRVQGVDITLKSSSLTFTVQSLSQLQCSIEALLPGITDEAGDPHKTTLDISYASNKFTGTASNVPAARIHGLKATINQLTLEIQNNQFQSGTQVNGDIVFDFLDQVNGNSGTIGFSVQLQNNGDVLYEAQNPDNHELKKGSVSIFFQQIRVLTHTNAAAEVDINGWVEVAGVNDNNGQSVKTTFDFSYADPRFEFTGKDFIPVPLGFGEMTFETVFLRIHKNGTLEQSDFEGKLKLPLFNNGQLDFEINFINAATHRLQIEVSNPANTPIQHGGFALLLNQFDLLYENDQLQDVTASGALTIPVITSGAPIQIEADFNRNGPDEDVRILANNFGSPELGGCELTFDKIEFKFTNGTFVESDINGRIKIPDTTDGAGIQFDLDIANQGNDYTISLDGTALDNELNLGPIQLAVEAFQLTVTNNSLQSVSGNGNMQLPGLSQAFAFSFNVDTSGSNPVYNITVNNVAATLGGFNLTFNTISVSSQKAQQFAAAANGTLMLPLFQDGGALDFNVTFDRNDNYLIAVASGAQFVKFGDFELKNVSINLDVQAGVLQDFTGSGDLQIPGFNSTTAVSVAYTESNNQYLIDATNAIDLELHGFNVHLVSFQLEILNNNFEACSATGTIKLPHTTAGLGIQFEINVDNSGENYTISLTGTPNQNTVEFGPLALKFNAFSLEIENGDVKTVLGNGELTIPGLSNPFAFSISADLNGPDPLYIIEILNVTANLESFNLDFDQIRIETKKAGDFDADINGNLALPVFDIGQIDFEVSVSQSSTYTIQIDGNGQVAKFGDVELRDVTFDLDVANGNVQSASGTASIFIPELTRQNAPFGVTVNYSKGANEDLALTATNLPQVNLSVFTLTISNLDFLIRNGSLETASITGSSTMPFFENGGNLSFSFAFNNNGDQYDVSLNSNQTLSFSGLEIKDVALTVAVKNKNLDSISGAAKFKIPGASVFTAVDVSYNGQNEVLNFNASSLPSFDIGGLTFDFAQFGFGLKNGNLDSTNFEGTVTIPLAENGHNQLAFAFNISDGNNYTIQVNPGQVETELKIGDISLFITQFNMAMINGGLNSISAQAGFEFDGFDKENNPGTPERFDIGFGYTSNTNKYDISYSGNKKISLGGFGLTIKTIALSFTPSSLEYPFSFTGSLEIPGLEKQGGGPAVFDVTINVSGPNAFSGSIENNAVIDVGSAKITLNSLAITKDQNGFDVKVTGTLEISDFSNNGKPATITVEVEIGSDGSFSVLGETDPALKVVDIESVIRIYLSKIGLSKSASNDWDFTIGGMIENMIVIPGMDDLLPNQLTINDLQFGQAFDLDIDIRWPSGLSISFGGAQSEAIIPVNGKFGSAISLDALKISYTNNNSSGADLGIAFSGATLMIGPLTATVEGLGLEAQITKPNFNAQGKPITPANFGVVNVDIEFKPPSGLGVSLNTPVFTGGGFLFFDDEKGEYAGALELSFMQMFAISAIGVINSKMPDGKPGTSVLVIISVEFSPGIALGFGFFISGLGGMLGIHRTMQVEKLREGVREGTIQNILFPKNIIANISRIISDIKEFFPVQRDQFIIGPMAAITWGVPTIVRIDVGLAIEFDNPVRFAILGVLRVILPDESTALVKIQVAFLGVLDLDKGMLSFDASLFDSKVLTFGMEGDMVLRLSWGEKKDFLISVGGFHPSYTPPTHLQIPTMKRLTLKILSGNPRLTLTSYFAITTNTVQFGAGIDFYFGVAGFKIVGEFGFDVLFQFSPFRFIADARARLAVKAGSATLFQISLSFTLEGPTPWRAAGTAKFTIFFFTVKARFDTTWGDKRDTSLPDIDVLPLLMEALEDVQNWRAITQTTHVDGLRMAPIAADEEDLILTPNGSIEITQKIVPLDVEISKFGQYKPADYVKFEIESTHIKDSENDANNSSNETAVVDVQDVFAPANFTDVGDKDKLALPSFEKQNAGIQLSGNSEMKSGDVKDREVKYEQLVMDEEVVNQPVLKIATMPAYQFAQRETTFFTRKGAVGASSLSANKSQIINPAKVVLKEPAYAVVDTNDLSAMAQTAGMSFMHAQAVLNETENAANYQVVTQDVVNV